MARPPRLLIVVGVPVSRSAAATKTHERPRPAPGVRRAASKVDVVRRRSCAAQPAGAAGQGKIYEVWLEPGRGAAADGALFTPRSDGSATATVTGDLHDGDQVLVTAEPAGGSPMPTANPLLAAQLT